MASDQDIDTDIETATKTGFYVDMNTVQVQQDQVTTMLCINLGQEPSALVTRKHDAETPLSSRVLDGKEALDDGRVCKELLSRRVLFVVDCSFGKKVELDGSLGACFEMINRIPSDTLVRLVGVSSEPSRKNHFTQVFPWISASAIQKSTNSMVELQYSGAYNLRDALTDIVAEIHFEKSFPSLSPSETRITKDKDKDKDINDKITTFTDVIVLGGSSCVNWSDPVNLEHGQVDSEMDTLGASIRSLLPDKHVQIWLFPRKYSDWSLCERLRDKCDVCARLYDTRFLLGEIIYSKTVVREYLAQQNDQDLLYNVEILVTKMDNGNLKADGSLTGNRSRWSGTSLKTHHLVTNYMQEHFNILTWRFASCRRKQTLCLPIYICKIANANANAKTLSVDAELAGVLDQIERVPFETKQAISSSFDFTASPQQVSLYAHVTAYDRSVNKYIRGQFCTSVKIQVEHLVETSVGQVDTKIFTCPQVIVQEWHTDFYQCIKECLRFFPIAISENLVSHRRSWPFVPLSAQESYAWLTCLQRLVTHGRFIVERALTIAAEYEARESKAIRESKGLQRQQAEKRLVPDVLLVTHVAKLMSIDVILLVFYGMDHHTADFAHYLATRLTEPRRLVGLYTQVSESGTVPLATDTASCLRNIGPQKAVTTHKWGAWDSTDLDCKFGQAGKHRTRGLLPLQAQLREVESFTREKRAMTGPSMPSAASTRRAKTYETLQELDALLSLEQVFINKTNMRLSTLVNTILSSGSRLHDANMITELTSRGESFESLEAFSINEGQDKKGHAGQTKVESKQQQQQQQQQQLPFVPSFGYNFDKFVSIANHTGDKHSKQWNAFRDEENDVAMEIKQDRKMIKVAKAKLTAEQRLLKERRLPYVMSQDVIDAALASELANAPTPMSEIPIASSDSSNDTFDLTAMTKALLNQVTAAPPRQSPEDADTKARAMLVKSVQDRQEQEAKFKHEREVEQQLALSTDSKDVPFTFTDVPIKPFDASVAKDSNGDLKMAFSETRESGDDDKTNKRASDPTTEARRKRRAEMESERRERKRQTDEAKGYIGSAPRHLPAPVTTQTEARAAASSTVSSIMAGLRGMSVQTLENSVEFPMGRDYEAGPPLADSKTLATDAQDIQHTLPGLGLDSSSSNNNSHFGAESTSESLSDSILHTSSGLAPVETVTMSIED